MSLFSSERITTGRQVPSAGGQARLAVTSNGNLWTVLQNGSSTEFWVLSKNADAWVRSPGGVSAPTGVFRIDADDFAHYVYVSGSRVYYMRGTPNADRTQWYWAAPVTLRSSSGLSQPDMVVHRTGGAWTAHVVYSRSNAYSSSITEYEWRIRTTETVDAGLPGDPSYLYSHDHDLYKWSTSNTVGPWSGGTETWTHSHTLGSPNPGPRTHTHSQGHLGSGSLTGKTRQIYGGTYYNSRVEYVRVDISASGEATVSSVTDLSPQYSYSAQHYPSIAFRHAGDEKNLSDPPDLMVAWSSGRSGASRGIRAKKATHSGGAWNWGTERAIDARYVPNSDHWVQVSYDGTAFVIGGLWSTGQASNLVLKERDVGDTTTTTLYTSPNLPTSGSGRKYLRGQFTYDGPRNVWVVSARSGEPYSSASPVVYNVWRRVDDTLEPEVLVSRHSSGYNTSQVLVRPGYVGDVVDWVFAFTSPSPYEVFHGRFELVAKNLKTKVSGRFLGGEIRHRSGGTFIDGETRSKRAGAFA